MHVASYAVGCPYGFDGLDRGYLVIVAGPVDFAELAFAEAEAEGLAAAAADLLEVGGFREALRGIKDFASADGGPPYTYIV